jgi:hypothetical protein
LWGCFRVKPGKLTNQFISEGSWKGPPKRVIVP